MFESHPIKEEVKDKSYTHRAYIQRLIQHQPTPFSLSLPFAFLCFSSFPSTEDGPYSYDENQGSGHPWVAQFNLKTFHLIIHSFAMCLLSPYHVRGQ